MESRQIKYNKLAKLLKLCDNCHDKVCELTNSLYTGCDFSDVRTVLEHISKRDDFKQIMADYQYPNQNAEPIDWDGTIEAELVMDKTGKFADIVFDWLNKYHNKDIKNESKN